MEKGDDMKNVFEQLKNFKEDWEKFENENNLNYRGTQTLILLAILVELRRMNFIKEGSRKFNIVYDDGLDGEEV